MKKYIIQNYETDAFINDFDTYEEALQEVHKLENENKGVIYEIVEREYTYDVCFDDDTASNNMGWKQTYDYCLSYIKMYNGTNESYFEDYKGGVVSIYCNETEEEVYSEDIH
jgi:hypothetical protein